METYLEQLCHGLQGRVRLKVLVSNDNRATVREHENGFPVVRSGSFGKLFSTSLSPGLLRELRNDDSDIVHLHMPNPAAVAAYLASGHRRKLVLTWHSDVVRQKLLGIAFGPFEQEILRRADKIIVASPNYLRSSEALRQHRDRCVVVPFGVPLNGDVPVREDKREISILSVGRLVYYKGFEYLVRAMAYVDARLTIVGEGPLRDSLELLAQELGVKNRVVFAGHVSDIETVYREADIFVLPSIARSEAFGIVQLEAMRAGLPVINTELDSGVPWVSIHNVTGLTVPPKDEVGLAAAINRLISDPGLRASFAQAAKARVEQHFSLGKMVDSTLAIYKELMNG